MSKSLFLTLLLTSITLFTLKAQEEKPALQGQYKHELGFNITSFIKQFVNFSDLPIGSGTSTLVSYRYFPNENNAWLFSLGGRVRYYNDVSETMVGDIDEYYSISASVGYQWLNNIGKKWQLYYGPVAAYTYTSDYNKSQTHINDVIYFERSNTVTNAYSAGAALGIQFFLNERLSLSTQSSYMFVFRTETEHEKYTNPYLNDYSYETENERFYSSFSLPISVTLRVGL